MISKLFSQFIKHKIAAGLILTAIAGISYWGYGKIFGNNGAISYTTAQVENGTLIVSVSGSGQVSSSNQVEVKTKAGGDIIYVAVKNGGEVKAGTLIAQLDTRDAEKAVRDAEINLENAKFALEKLKLQQQQQLRGDTLNKTYEDGMKTLADFYRDFGAVLNKIEDILFGNDLSDNEDNISYYANYFLPYNQKSPIPNSSEKLFSEIKKLHQQALVDFENAERGSGDARGQAISSGYELAVKTAQLIKLGSDAVRMLYDYYIFSDSVIHTKEDIIRNHNNDLATYASTINTYLQSLLAAKNTINSHRDKIENQQLDLYSQEIAVKQKENALLDAKEKLSDYYIRAPFAGIIGKVNFKKGDSVSLGTTIATLITAQKIAEISLNEVDFAKVKVGQKATLTFDAVPDLTITGQVVEVDTVGTVSQGVVNYTVKIDFDTQDDRVKPGMSVSAVIITEAKPNILLVPNSAIKSQAGMNYVEIPDERDRNTVFLTNTNGVILKYPLRQQKIEIGTTNDDFTEIVSGLEEGDLVIIRAIQPNSKQTQNKSSQGGLKFPGLRKK